MMKKILKYLLVFTIIGTFVSVSVLAFVNNFLYNLSNSSILGNESDGLKGDSISSSKNIKIYDDMKDIQFSYNNKYYTYLKNDNIEICSLDKKEIVTTIDEEKPICFYNLLYDKNLIMYFTTSVNGNVTKLQLNTYDITSKRKIEYSKINVTNFSSVKQIEFSPIINMIYINVETKNGNLKNNIVYKINLFNSVSTVTSGKIINKLGMLKHTDKLYYEDTNGNIYYAGSKSYIFKSKVHLIGTDFDDYIYFINANTKSEVYKVKNNKIIETITLTDSDITSWYSDNDGVYLVYPTYIINIASEDRFKRISKLSNYVSFITIKGNTVYLKTNDNIIVKTSLNT